MSTFLETFEELSRLNETLSSNILYHRTSLNNAIDILTDNTLNPDGSYFYNIKHGKCICFSRDYEFIKRMPGEEYVIFVFDKDRLTTKYKIQPITDYKNMNIAKGRYVEGSKAEEVCFKAITDIQKYILKIIVSDSNFDTFVENLSVVGLSNLNNSCIKASEYAVRNLE